MVNTNPHLPSTNAPRSRSSLTAGLCLSLFGGPFIAGFALVVLHSWVLGPILWAVVVTILDGLVPERERTAAKRAAVRGWLWFMDGVLLDWIEHGDRETAEVANSLVDSLVVLLG